MNMLCRKSTSVEIQNCVVVYEAPCNTCGHVDFRHAAERWVALWIFVMGPLDFNLVIKHVQLKPQP